MKKGLIALAAASLALASCNNVDRAAAPEASPAPAPAPVMVPAPPPPPPPPMAYPEEYESAPRGYSYYPEESEVYVEGYAIPVEEIETAEEAGPPPITFDDVEAQLKQSTFGYEVPDALNIEETGTVRLIVNPAKSEAQVETTLGDGNTYVSTILISRVLQAQLTSSDFIITPLTPTRQVVDDNTDTVWMWEIEPKSAGENKTLKINVSALISVDGERTERFIDTYEGTVQVDISTGQVLSAWIADNWQWAWGALLIPIGGYFWSRRSKKNEDS